MTRATGSGHRDAGRFQAVTIYSAGRALGCGPGGTLPTGSGEIFKLSLQRINLPVAVLPVAAPGRRAEGSAPSVIVTAASESAGGEHRD